MFNLGGCFVYLHCQRCGTLSAEKSPPDLARYYPENGYYSFCPPAPRRAPGFRQRINAAYDRLIGIQVLNLELIRRYLPDASARILDVGAGAGQKLHSLLAAGYSQLAGVDPFLPLHLERESPFRLKRCTVREAGGDWDLIMYHHVLEHVADPGAEIAAAAAQLKDGGYLLIRVPVADSWAFAHYGTNWVQLDPPRHLCVPTRKALVALGREHGLVIREVRDDSTPFQRWASRHYVTTTKPLSSAKRWGGRPSTRLLRIPALLCEMAFSSVLNFCHAGDQSCFIFQKIPAG